MKNLLKLLSIEKVKSLLTILFAKTFTFNNPIKKESTITLNMRQMSFIVGLFLFGFFGLFNPLKYLGLGLIAVSIFYNRIISKIK